MNIISIDPSKYSTGVFIQRFGQEVSFTISHTKKMTDEEVYLNIYYIFMRLFEENQFDIGFIEGYWLSNPRGMLYLPEIGGIIKLTFAINNVPLITIPIQTWKNIVKIKIDKHKKKKEYLAVVNRRYNKEFKNIDEADAYLIYITARTIIKNTNITSKAQKRIREKIKGVTHDKNT